MKKIIFLLSLTILSSCSGTRQARTMMTSGDYDNAIRKSVEKLRSNKTSKSKQDYVYVLEESFAKAKERDLREINTWFKDKNPSNFEKIYNTYLQLNYRQELIRPLLPLRLQAEGRDAIFPFEDYSDQMVSSKNALAKYLYDNSKALLGSKDKTIIRRAYDDLMYLESISSGYKDVNKLIGDARFKGTDFVFVNTKNETNMVIPTRLEGDLLDFSTYGLNDKWTIYHNKKQKETVYDYGLTLNFRQIAISPEQVKEKQFEKEKQIKDGVKTLLDAKGNVIRDSLGKAIQVDNMKTIRVSIYEFSQLKSCQITAKVDFVNLKTSQLIETFPITSEFVFSNVYASYKGDRQACEESYYPTFERKAIPFPSSEQMIFDTGRDLKAKLKDIVVKNKFRR